MAPGIGVEVRTRDAQVRRDLASDGLRDFALKRQYVLRVALVLFRPELTFAPGFYELYCNSDAAPGRSDAPLEYVAHAQLGTNPVGSLGGFLELHGRRPCDDPETRRIH